MMQHRPRLAVAALWAAYALALLASLAHVAAAFADLETAGPVGTATALAGAIAVDAGLAAIAWALAQRARRGRPTWPLLAGLALFASISALANTDHALAVRTGAPVALATFGQLDAWQLVKALALSATLPVLVVLLARIIADAAEAEATPEPQPEPSPGPVYLAELARAGIIARTGEAWAALPAADGAEILAGDGQGPGPGAATRPRRRADGANREA